jgi:hypothetical protein
VTATLLVNAEVGAMLTTINGWSRGNYEAHMDDHWRS